MLGAALSLAVDYMFNVHVYLIGQIEEVDITVGNHGIRVDGLGGYIGQSKQLII